MIEPPEEQVVAGLIARQAIALGVDLAKSPIKGTDLDQEIETFIRDNGCEPALKGYHPSFATKPYQHTICLSPPTVAVHGVPTSAYLPRGRLITIDLVVRHKGWHADTARTFMNYRTRIRDDTSGGIFVPSLEGEEDFVNNSRKIFHLAKTTIGPNQPVRNFGTLVERGAEVCGCGVIKEYTGHGIGQRIHEGPQIPNYDNGSSDRFEIGKSYAVEPVLSQLKRYSLSLGKDGYTVYVFSNIASHNEDTIFIGRDKVYNLTGLD